MAKTSPQPAVTILDNPASGDVFTDGVIGVFLLNGNVHITLGSHRSDYSKQPNVFHDVVIGRVVMPFVAAENAVQFLGEFLTRMKQQAATAPPDTPLH